jgi:outer membrane lipoprotein-sorting protein
MNMNATGKWMGRAVLPVVLGMAMAGGGVAQPPVAAPAAPVDPDVAQVAAYIRAVTTMSADFAQTDRNGQILTGKLTLKQPGKIRFQYQKGVPLLIIGDGRALTVIDYEVRQVSRWPIGSSPLGALVDPRRDFARFGRVVQTGDPRVISFEARDPKRPEFGTLTLIFNRKPSAPAGLELYGWVSRDAQNNRTAVRLYNQVYGAPVADSAFRWIDPRVRAAGVR